MNQDLKAICERIVRLEEEKRALAEDIKDVKAEAKAKGYDITLLNATVKLMLMDAGKRDKALEQHELLDTYLCGVGLLPDHEELLDEDCTPSTASARDGLRREEMTVTNTPRHLSAVPQGETSDTHVSDEVPGGAVDATEVRHSEETTSPFIEGQSETSPTHSSFVREDRLLPGTSRTEATGEVPPALSPVAANSEEEIPSFLRRTREPA